jgi:L-glyceraldehyde 3-phosphate reductase
MSYIAHSQRYEVMQYRTCGRSGLQLPLLSLGLWHNFGNATPYAVQREMVITAFDLGITHFDLANNYGPPPGAAEELVGDVLARDFRP